MINRKSCKINRDHIVIPVSISLRFSLAKTTTGVRLLLLDQIGKVFGRWERYFITAKIQGIFYMYESYIIHVGWEPEEITRKKADKRKKKLWNVSDLKRLDLPNVKHSYSLSRLPANLAIICTNKTIPLHIRYITHVWTVIVSKGVSGTKQPSVIAH